MELRLPTLATAPDHLESNYSVSKEVASDIGNSRIFLVTNQTDDRSTLGYTNTDHPRRSSASRIERVPFFDAMRRIDYWVRSVGPEDGDLVLG